MSKIQSKFHAYWQLVKKEIHEDKFSFAVFWILRLLVLITLIRQIYLGHYESALMCILTLILFILPSMVSVTFRLDLPVGLQVIIYLFIFSAEILGEINSFYVIIPFWDTILHTLNGFLCAAIGFSFALLFNRSENVVFTLSPVYLALMAFCFSMTVGVLWEFFEFSIDTLFLTDMQKDTIIHAFSSVLLNPDPVNEAITFNNITSTAVNGQTLNIQGYLDIGLFDTMEDLFVNFIGALVFSIIGFFYARSKGEGKLVRYLVPTPANDAPAKQDQKLQ